MELSWHDRLLGPNTLENPFESPIIWFGVGAVLLYTLRFFAERLFVKVAFFQGPWNTRLIPPVLVDKGRKVKNIDKNVYKFKDSAWFFSYYTIMFFFGLFLLDMGECFYRPTEVFFKEYLLHDFTLPMKIFYGIQVGYYISSIIYLFTDTRQEHSDWIMMVTHHVTCIVLAGGCVMFGYYRIGIYSTWLHDISDIFLEFAKMLRYMGSTFGKDFVFFLFACIFTVTRGFVYPVKVVYVVWYESADMAAPSVIPLLEFFGVFLLILLLLDYVWCGFIWVMAYRMLWTKELHGDIRSDDEKEEDDMEPVLAKDKIRLTIERSQYHGTSQQSGSISCSQLSDLANIILLLLALSLVPFAGPSYTCLEFKLSCVDTYR